MQEDKSVIFQMRFPQKLWYLLDLRTDAIMWGGTGRTILLNYHVLSDYLQCDLSIFKTNNISSFVRQLNLYGFRKVTSHLQDPLCNSSNPYMHEYVHDYFQFGRPELLNKITRKALTMKRNFKPRNAFNNTELQGMTPLQKARHALRMALKKASQDFFLQKSPHLAIDYEDSQDELAEEEETIEFDWPSSNKQKEPESISPPKTAPTPATEEIPKETSSPLKEQEIFGDTNQLTLVGFKYMPNQQNSESFPSEYAGSSFLSMPDLEAESTTKCDMELLAEFNIKNDVDEGIIPKLHDENGHNSLNCVLPSINQGQIDDEITELHDEFNGEWDQMFSDIMTNRGPMQEYGSDLRDLYSQISKTIDLLNS